MESPYECDIESLDSKAMVFVKRENKLMVAFLTSVLATQYQHLSWHGLEALHRVWLVVTARLHPETAGSYSGLLQTHPA